MLNDLLTVRQRRFVDEYLVDYNATQAAIRAGYSVHTAMQTGHETLCKPLVRRLIDERIAAVARRNGLDADHYLLHLKRLIHADLADIFTSDNRLRSVHEWPLIWRQGLVRSFRVDDTGHPKLNRLVLTNRAPLIKMMGRAVGAFR